MPRSQKKANPANEALRAFERQVVAAILAAHVCAGRYGPQAARMEGLVEHDAKVGREAAQRAWAVLAEGASRRGPAPATEKKRR